MPQSENNRELELHREIPFPRELAWKAITDPAHMQHWWGPDGFTIEDLTMDLRVGGIWKFIMVGPDGTRFPNHSVFTEITPPSRLAFDHGDGERVWFKATMILEETDFGTRVIIHQLYPSQESRDEVVNKYGAIEGGKQHLQKLETYIRENLA